MSKEEIMRITMKAKNLKEDDYFSACVFYYMAGRFPELSISQCADVVTDIRDFILAGGDLDD